MNTRLSIQGERFLINGMPTYSEIPDCAPEYHGLLMNARFVQGIFDDQANPERFVRFGANRWDPEANTQGLIESLPLWHRYGLRAFTVGLQGGMPVFTIENASIDNNPYADDGKAIDLAYLLRLSNLIRGADEAGMVVIVSLLYEGQVMRMKDGAAIRNAVCTAATWLGEQNFTNVIIEIANEYDIGNFRKRPQVSSPECMTALIEIARQAADGIPVAASGSGSHVDREVAESCDLILIHGNGTYKQRYYELIKLVRSWNLNKPIVCNEDSPLISQLDVAFDTYTSWGYYNNLAKQEPPVDWGFAGAEDMFFARRMARGLGIDIPCISSDQAYVLEGVQGRFMDSGKRWIRLASENPETIRRVVFLVNDRMIDLAYQEPFFVDYKETWIQGGTFLMPGDVVKAVVHLMNGKILERVAIAD